MNLDDVKLTTERGNELVEFKGRLFKREHCRKGPYSSKDDSKITTYYTCNSKECRARLLLVQARNPQTGERGDAEFVERNDRHCLSCVEDVSDIVKTATADKNTEK